MERSCLILLRHGETLWNVEGRYQGQMDSPLSKNGLEQAGFLAARLEGHQFRALYSSDLGRAFQTAEIIGKHTSHETVADPSLRERHLGIFQGLSKAEIRQKFAAEYRLFKDAGADYVVPGGESAAQAAQRMIGGLETLARRHSGESIVVVTHGGVTSALLRHTLGIPQGAPRRFERANASWNVFWYEDRKWFLETWGDISHLRGNGSGS